MGYYSQVECRIHGNKDQILDGLALLRLTHPRQQLLSEALDACYLTAGKDGTGLFGWSFESTKWYDNYDDVRVFLDIWDFFESKEGISGALVRIGEDTSDIESQYFGDEGDELAIVERYIDAARFDGENLLSSTLESAPVTTQGTT